MEDGTGSSPHFNFLLPQETKKGKETLSNLKLIIFQHGFVPDLIQADSGKEFTNQAIENFVRALTGKGISHGPPRDPRPQALHRFPLSSSPLQR